MRLLKKYTDWLLLAILVTTVLIGALFAWRFFQDDAPIMESGEKLKTYPMKTSGIQEIVPPDNQYPVSAKEQRGFYTSYTEGNVLYTIERVVTNASREPSIGQHEFRLQLRNLTDKHLTPTGEQLSRLNIGCIAFDRPYREASFDVAAVELEPFEIKDVKLTIHATCMYLGTQDKTYFWRIY